MPTITIYAGQDHADAFEVANLEGTEKQVAWAEHLRRDGVEQLCRGLNDWRNRNLVGAGEEKAAKVAKVYDEAWRLIGEVAKNPSARHWIVSASGIGRGANSTSHP